MNKTSILINKILEILSHTYDFTHVAHGLRTHQYNFRTDKGNKYYVSINHGYNDDGSHHAEVNFATDDDNQTVRLNSSEKGSAHKVLSTVAKIVKHHSKKFPEVDPYNFSGDNDHESVYRAMAKRMAKHHLESPMMFDYGDGIVKGTYFTVKKSDLK